jgi:N-acyl-L-homoserine lactone synthetase
MNPPPCEAVVEGARFRVSKNHFLKALLTTKKNSTRLVLSFYRLFNHLSLFKGYITICKSFFYLTQKRKKCRVAREGMPLTAEEMPLK